MLTNIDTCDLIIFGDFGVLTNTPFKDHQPLHTLPGRAEYLAFLQEDRRQRDLAPLHYAVTGNKGGVAWESQTEEEATEEVRWTAEQIGSKLYRVCFALPHPQVGFEKYAAPDMLKRRKPRPAMFQEVIEELGVEPGRVLIVDHYADSFTGSRKLGTLWEAPGTFFAEAERYKAPAGQVGAPLDLDLFDIDACLLAQQEEG